MNTKIAKEVCLNSLKELTTSEETSNTGVKIPNDILTNKLFQLINDLKFRVDLINDKTLYNIGDGEFSIFLRPDGDDSNTGLENTSTGALKTLDGVVDFLKRYMFIGGGWITVYIADGEYEVGELNPFDLYDVIFLNAKVSFPEGPPDVIESRMLGIPRIRFVGNINNPDNVVIKILSKDDLRNFTVSECGVYGVSLEIESGSSTQIRGTCVSGRKNYTGYLGNCCIISGPDGGVARSPYAAFRGSGQLFLYGTIKIRSKLNWQPMYIFWPEDGASYYFGHYAANMTDSGDLYILSPLTLVIESSISGWVSTYYCGPVGLPSMGFVRVASSSITAQVPSGERYRIEYPNVFYSNGVGPNFFPGATNGVSTVPSSSYF